MWSRRIYLGLGSTTWSLRLTGTSHSFGGYRSPSDMLREYQNWLTREMELLAEDGKACQQQVLRAGAHLRAQQEDQQQVLTAAAHRSTQPEEPETGKRRTG